MCSQSQIGNRRLAVKLKEFLSLPAKRWINYLKASHCTSHQKPSLAILPCFPIPSEELSAEGKPLAKNEQMQAPLANERAQRLSAREPCALAARLAKFSKEKILRAKPQHVNHRQKYLLASLGLQVTCEPGAEQQDTFFSSISRHCTAQLKGDGSELWGCAGSCTWERVAPDSVKTLPELSLLDFVLLLFCSPEIRYG